MNLDDYSTDEVNRTKVLVYGPPFAGKTTEVGKLAIAGYKLWWFDFDHGVKSLLREDMIPKEFRKNISVFNIPDSMGVPVAYEALRQVLRGGDKKFCFDHGVNMCPICSKTAGAKWSETINIAKFGPKDILVGDSLTTVADSALNKLTLKDRQKDPEYKLTFNDFGNQGMYMKEILSKIQTSNINVCLIGHQIDAEKSESKEKIVPIAGTRNYSLTVAKYFDSVVYMQVLNKQYKAYSSAAWSNTHVTGDRGGIELENTAGASLKDIFEGKKGK